MNEKNLERVTGLSRRQIIQLQKKVILREKECHLGVSYDYSDDEVKLFILAKFFKDCGYKYIEIKEMIDLYFINKKEAINKSISKMEEDILCLENNIKRAKQL